jgi:hypothetical protein
MCACQNMPAPYAPPEQREPFENFAPYRISRVVEMADGDADKHFVRDIRGQSGTWRWTGKHPEVHVFLRTNQMLHCIVDFTIVEATFKDTGPVTLTFFVNGHVLGTERYTASGPQHFDKPVPPEWVEAGKETTVGAEIDKVWVSPADQAALGFILTRMGLAQTGTDQE